MGYIYESIGGASGGRRGRLVCDGCGNCGGVRKRTCTFVVVGSSHRTTDGQRHGLPYCPPPALCASCYKEAGGSKIHAGCRAPAAESQARYDEEQSLLDSGAFLLAYGIGGDRSGRDGYVLAGFVGRHGVEATVLIPSGVYNKRGANLAAYPEAVAA